MFCTWTAFVFNSFTHSIIFVRDQFAHENKMNRRVVVTGIGLVTPLGVGAPRNWTQLTQGITATRKIVDPQFEKVG